MVDAIDSAKAVVVFGESMFDHVFFEVGCEVLFVLEDAFVHVYDVHAAIGCVA